MKTKSKSKPVRIVKTVSKSIWKYEKWNI